MSRERPSRLELPHQEGGGEEFIYAQGAIPDEMGSTLSRNGGINQSANEIHTPAS